MTEPMVQLDSFSKGFDGVTVLKGLTNTILPGEVIGLLGLNGAGKTTLLETLLGFALPDAGSIRLFGVDTRATLDAATKARIGFVPQRDELVDTMTGEQYLNLIAAFYLHWNRSLIERLTLEWSVPLNTRIAKLSVGQRQKLSILAALGHEPELLVLDEPVASLDPLARRQFLKELVSISAATTRSILFSTHIVSDLERIASRLWLLRDGELALDTALDDIKERVVRVHLRTAQRAPILPPGLQPLRQRREAQGSILLFDNWDDEMARLLGHGDGIEVETLSLEEIFLELHA